MTTTRWFYSTEPDPEEIESPAFDTREAAIAAGLDQWMGYIDGFFVLAEVTTVRWRPAVFVRVADEIASHLNPFRGPEVLDFPWEYEGPCNKDANP